MSVVGFEKHKDYFMGLLGRSSLSHAYLFSGPEMIGKREFALELFRLINDLTQVPVRHDPDLKYLAPGARDADLPNFANYLPPKGDKSGQEIYLEEVLAARAFLATTPFYGPRKVLIINDAQAMGAESSNALLKILEEPPSASLFILVTSQPKRILPTIASRCQEMRFLPLSDEILAEQLKPLRLNKDDAALVLLLAGGRLGWVLRLLEAKKLPELRRAVDEFQAVLKRGVYERMQYAKKVHEEGTYPELIDIWTRWIRAHGKNPQKTVAVLRDLIGLNDLISRPEMNHRLALENFLIRI